MILPFLFTEAGRLLAEKKTFAPAFCAKVSLFTSKSGCKKHRYVALTNTHRRCVQATPFSTLL